MKYENLPSKLVESPISRNGKLRTEATTERAWARLLRGAFVLLLGSRSNARCSYECWEVFRWRLAFDHGAFHLCALIVTFVNVSLALVYTKAKQVVLPDT